jgi:hypothetical protein
VCHRRVPEQEVLKSFAFRASPVLKWAPDGAMGQFVTLSYLLFAILKQIVVKLNSLQFGAICGAFWDSGLVDSLKWQALLKENYLN